MVVSLSARSSAINIGLPWRTLPPANDNDADSASQRAHLAMAYASGAVLVSLAGALTPAGVLVNSASKVLGGALEPAGDALKSTAKQVAGALEPAGALLNQAHKVLGGALEPAGSLLRATTKAMGGELAPAGVALKSVAKVLAGALTPSGVVATTVTTVIRLFEFFNGSFTRLTRLAGRVFRPGLRGSFGRSEVEGEMEND